METNTVYLNNAATSYPKPKEVADAVQTCITSAPHDPRRGSLEDGTDIVEECRSLLARFFGAKDPSTLIFTSSATESLNLFAFGSHLEGGCVITTAAEHNSALRPLKTLEQRRGVGVTIAPCDGSGRVDPGGIEAAIGPTTRAIFVTHASNVTGAVNDIAGIARLAHDHGVQLFVDASQSAGCVPVNASEWDADGIAFAGHKGLFGISGVGGAILKRGLNLEPLKVGGTGALSESLLQPSIWPMRFEAGTANLPGIAALRAGVGFVLRNHLHTVAHQENPVNALIDEGLRSIPGVVLHGCPGLDNRLPIWSISVGTMDPVECAYLMQSSFGITTRAGLHCAPLIHKFIGSFPSGSVRISPSFFTTLEDAHRLLDALRRIAAHVGRIR